MSVLAATAVSVGTATVKNIGDRLIDNAKRLATDPNMVNAKSLSQFTKDLHLRPRLAIEREIINDENMGALVQTAVSNYGAYFVLALSVDNTIGGVSVGRMVGKYNSSASTENAVIDIVGDALTEAVGVGSRSGFMSRQSYDDYGFGGTQMGEFAFPTLPKSAYASAHEALSLQAKDRPNGGGSPEFEQVHGMDSKPAAAFGDDEYREEKDADGNDILLRRKHSNSTTGDSSTAKELAEAQNLAVGKIIEVTVKRDQASAVVQMLLKPVISVIGSKQIVYVASSGHQALSGKDRAIKRDRGLIESAWDYLSAADLWKAHRKRLVEDTSGYYEETHNKRRGAGVRALLTGQWGIGEIANTFIISSSTATRLEVGIRAKLSNTRARDKFMEDVGVMTLIVYSPEHQRVMIYNHGLDEVSNISMSYLMKKAKNKDFDFDIFKLMQQGSAPIL